MSINKMLKSQDTVIENGQYFENYVANKCNFQKFMPAYTTSLVWYCLMWLLSINIQYPHILKFNKY